MRGSGHFQTSRVHEAEPRSLCHVGMSQNQTTKGPQLLVIVSIYQGAILGAYF